MKESRVGFWFLESLMRRVTLNCCWREQRAELERMDEQDFTVSYDVPYFLLEGLKRTQLRLPRFYANCVMTKGIICAGKAPRNCDDSTCHWGGRSGGICSERAEGQLGVVVYEDE